MDLFVSTNGRVVCPDHLGAEASAVLRVRPAARRIATTLDSWERLTADEVEAWLAEGFGCEACEPRHAPGVHLEARCGLCGETFTPYDEDDLVHIEGLLGPCGGIGALTVIR